MRSFSILALLIVVACHDVNSIARYDAGDNDVPAFDGGPNFDAGPDVGFDAGPGRDAGPLPGDAGPPPVDGGSDTGPGPDAGPPPEPIAVVFERPFNVRAAVPLSDGILVVGVDNQGDRDTEMSRQGLVAYIADDRMSDWANNYGGPTNNDQFLVAINNGPDEAVVLGIRGVAGEGSVIVSRFRAVEGLVDTVAFSAVAPFITDAVFVDDDLYASGRSGGDAVVFQIDLALGTMNTLGSGRSGAFNGIAVHDGTVYAAGQSPVGAGGSGILAMSSLSGSDLTVYTLPNAEFISVAANASGATAVGTRDGQGLHMELRGESPTVRIASDIARFRQVDFIGATERYVGLTSDGGNFAFVGERVADEIRVAFTRMGYVAGVSGRLAMLQDGGFLASQDRVDAPDNRVQVSRFAPLEGLPQTGCDRERANSSLNENMAIGAEVMSSTPTTIPGPAVMGSPVSLTTTAEDFTRNSSCPQ